MRSFLVILVILLGLFHLAAFAAEAVFWMNPTVHELFLSAINPGQTTAPLEQAAILKTALISQGAYNLLLALGALAGLWMILTGRAESGVVLVGFAAVVALGAGLVLIATTQAYVGGAVQAGIGALTLILTAMGAAAPPGSYRTR